MSYAPDARNAAPHTSPSQDPDATHEPTRPSIRGLQGYAAQAAALAPAVQRHPAAPVQLEKGKGRDPELDKVIKEAAKVGGDDDYVREHITNAHLAVTTAAEKAGMIVNLLRGFTGDADEQKILFILRSGGTDATLAALKAQGHLGWLFSDMDGAEFDQLLMLPAQEIRAYKLQRLLSRSISDWVVSDRDCRDAIDILESVVGPERQQLMQRIIDSGLLMNFLKNVSAADKKAHRAIFDAIPVHLRVNVLLSYQPILDWVVTDAEATEALELLHTVPIAQIDALLKKVKVDKLLAELPDDQKKGLGPLVVGIKDPTLKQKVLAAYREGDAATDAKDPHEFAVIRFTDDAVLAEIAAGKRVLTAGASGIPVTKIQHALVELGSLAADKVTGKLDKTTAAALATFQTGAGVAASGEVDRDTVLAFDVAFGGHRVEGKVLEGIKPSRKPTEGKPYKVGTAPKELLDGTRAVTQDESDAFAAAISTEVKKDPKTGKLPTFTNPVDGKSYAKRLEETLNLLVDHQLKWAKALEKDRKGGNLYSWGDIDKVATASKVATDSVFGSYALGKPLSGLGADPKIKDAWAYKEKHLKADPGLADGWAEWRVRKLLNGNKHIAAIDKKHGAMQSRSPEKGIAHTVKMKIVGARKADLVLIHKAWPAFADAGKVFIQRVKDVDDKGGFDKATGRSYMWDIFQTVIHEYIHTLEHPKAKAYRGGLGSQKGGFTLREGVTDYFTKVAYNNTDTKVESLRKTVEGPFWEKGVTHPIPKLGTYKESANAERAAGIVGLKNLCGYFYLGQTELIHKP